MANVPPPPSSKAKGKPRLQVAPPAPAETPDNLSKPTEDTLDLNFKVPADFHREFKVTATLRGMKMKDLLIASFNAWKEKHGE